jgi:rod shape-determining protein MreD
MISFLSLTALIFFTVIFQITFLEHLSIGSVSIEITPVLVIYAGFRLDALYGGIFSFLLGLFVDSLISPIVGLYTLIYVLFFYISLFTSEKINSDNMLSLSLFAGVCFLLQGVLIILFYWLILDENIINLLFKTFLPQAVLMGIVSPFLYRIIKRIEVLFYAEDRKPDRRL